MKKRIIAFGLALFAVLGLPVLNASALAGGNMSCTQLKTTLGASSTETGSAIIVLTEDCVANLTIKSGQDVTLDTAGHTLSSTSGVTITVEKGGQLTLNNFSNIGTMSGTTAIENSGTVSIVKGNITGNLSVKTGATTAITGGSFSVDPSAYLADGYTVASDNGRYIVSKAEESSDLFDTSKITSDSAALKAALVATMNEYIEDPDATSLNGRMLAQLKNSIDMGHTLSVSLNINTDPEFGEAAYSAVVSATYDVNLAQVVDVQFVVSDVTNPSLSVSLSHVATPIDVVIPVPSQYSAALATRDVSVFRIYQDSDEEGEYWDSDKVASVGFTSDGDLTFNTEDFAFFAIAYAGDTITTSMSGGTSSVPLTGAANTAGGSGGTAILTSSSVTAPDTAGFFGIELTVFHLLMLSAAMLVVIVFTAYALKRAYIRHKISLK